MSELKAINAYQLTTNTEDSDVYIHNDEFGCGGDLIECYLKSEADKVFRRLKARLARKGISNQQLEADKNHNWRKYCTAMTELRHQKYKRCLAMARWCRMHDRFIQLESERLGLAQSTLFLEYRRESMWWNKWHKRWLELAEKFKEAK